MEATTSDVADESIILLNCNTLYRLLSSLCDVFDTVHLSLQYDQGIPSLHLVFDSDIDCNVVANIDHKRGLTSIKANPTLQLSFLSKELWLTLEQHPTCNISLKIDNERVSIYCCEHLPPAQSSE